MVEEEPVARWSWATVRTSGFYSQWREVNRRFLNKARARSNLHFKGRCFSPGKVPSAPRGLRERHQL